MLNLEDYAIVIGIDAYPQLPSLSSAGQDATAFADWLASPDGGGLPRENIRLVLSPAQLPADPLDARPIQRDVDRAIRDLGVESGRRIGRRLYFYFAGHAFGAGSDDVGLLMADASQQRLNRHIGLGPYRRFFRAHGLFDEMVFILDCDRVAPVGPEPAAPVFALPSENSPPAVPELLLLALPQGAPSGVSANAGTGERRGLLTRAVLEGLQGTAETEGRITAASLRDYVLRRVPELAQEAGPMPQAEISSSTREMVLVDRAGSRPMGTLRVEVPHWTAQVRVVDGSFRQIPHVGAVQEDPQIQGRYRSETILPPGIYQVEVSVEGKAEQQLVVVRPDETSLIKQSAWKGLRPASAAPLAGTTTTRRTHADEARDWSRRITWSDGRGGAGRLFLFVRTLKRKPAPSFADGLYLLNAEGSLVTDFSQGVEKNVEAGWMAFTADLPPGCYVLQRQRPKVRARFQPIYVSPDWETQVFLPAQEYPSLSTLALYMAPRGVGFQPDDPASVATDAVLRSLHRRRGERLVTGEHVSALLQGEHQNPWLAVLAAHVLLGAREEAQLLGRPEQAGLADPDRIARVLAFLSVLGDHPDARALQLSDNEPAPAPCPHPPMLRAGLKRVQRHAIRFAGTIPPDSLTDCVLPDVVTNSPWTGWRHLDRLPRFGVAIGTPAADDTERPVARRAAPSFSYHAAISPAFLYAVPQSAPVFPLARVRAAVAADEPMGDVAADPGESFDAAAGGLESVSAGPGARPREEGAAPIAALWDLPVIQAAQRLTETGNLDELGPTLKIQPAQSVERLLQSIRPEEVSAACGLTLDHTQRGLKRLQESSAGATGAPAPGTPLTGAEQAIVDYALRKVTAGGGDSGPSALPASAVATLESTTAVTEAAGAAGPGAATPSLTIEEAVGRLRSEADRLSGPEGQTREVAERLRKVAARLLEHADFVVITDAQQRLTWGNGAIKGLLVVPWAATSDPTPEASRLERQRQENQRAWEAALASAPAGRGTLPSPVPDLPVAAWDLRRAVVEDESTGEVRGYLNLLRVPGASRLKAETLQRLEPLLPQLSLYASFVAHGKGEHPDDDRAQLEALTSELEQMLDNDEGRSPVMDNTRAMDPSTPTPEEDPELKQEDGSLFEREFWGVPRHELIAGAAEELLQGDPKAKHAREEIARILKPLSVGLSDVAGWADGVKRRGPDPSRDDAETVAFLKEDRNKANDTWHYVDLPLDAEGYDLEKYRPFSRDDDVVQILTESIRVLQRQSNRFSELNALRLVVHLVGDVHQPIHVGCGYLDRSVSPARLVRDPQVARQKRLQDDQGGNALLLPISSSGVSLHSYWDSRLGGGAHDPAEGESDAVDVSLKARFIQKLVGRITGGMEPQADADTAADVSSPTLWPAQWATESLIAARSAYQSLVIKGPHGSKFDVTWEGKSAYDKRCAPIVNQRLEQAGQNLAALLKAIWP